MSYHLNKRILTSILILFLVILKSISNIANGEWRTHLSYHNPEKSLAAFGKIYSLCSGSIYSYDPEDRSIQTFDKINTLSDSKIVQIAYSASEKAIILVYDNGNIDLLYEDNDIFNIPDFHISDLSDKTVNDIYIHNRYAYLSTNFGVIVLNTYKKEISNSFYLGYSVNSSIIREEKIFCTTTNGIFSGNLSDNLLDFSNWIKTNPYSFNKIFEFDNKLFALSNDNKVWFLNSNGSMGSETLITGISSLSLSQKNLIVIKDSNIIIYNTINTYNQFSLDNYPVSFVFFDGTYYWISYPDSGLNGYKIVNNSLKKVVQGVIPNSPKRNYFNYMDFSPDGRLLVVGGSLNYSGVDYEGTVMILNDNSWSYFPENIKEITQLNYINLTSIAQNYEAENGNQYFVSSARHGLYEFREGNFYKLHTYNNSGLTTIIPSDPKNYVSVDGLKYDIHGNLWMLNNEVDTIIKILKKDGNWIGLYYPEIKGLPTFKQILFDSNGLIWINSSRYKPGIFCLNINGTLDDTSDDTHRFIGPYFTNQDGVSEEINDLFFIEEDFSGTIWLGTDKGIFTIDNPVNFINSNNPIFNRIKIPRNDGTNYADYLLSGIYTTSICIDNANRKWIGTQNNGVFLISDDGIETIFHFTSSNSPLLSDNILSIEINRESGQVYFGTSNGLIEYGGDATMPSTKLSESNIEVYPNPVTPYDNNIVTIIGLSENSDVKIINSRGNLVYRGVSNGGAFTWRCIDNTGKRVASGIYFALISNRSNTIGAVAKIAVIN